MARIALLHFTGPPAIGGVESILSVQADVLTKLGHQVRVVVGKGNLLPSAELIVLDELAPQNAQVVAAFQGLAGQFPLANHPLVQCIETRLRRDLADCDWCWVHNAFTVYLNPFLTVALMHLAESSTDARWCAWCYDLTGTSRHQPSLTADEHARVARPIRGMTYVTPTKARACELRNFFRAPSLDVQVIPLPLNLGSWLGLHQLSRTFIQELGIFEADLVVLVPAKLLPHKRLDLAVAVLAALRDITPRPLMLITGASSPHEAPVSARVLQELLAQSRSLHIAESLRVLSEPQGAAIDREVVRDLMLLSDLVFLPSDEEGYGMPIAEAAALRVPVLCSDIPAFREVGAGWAEYFGGDESPLSIVKRMIAISQSPSNLARRRILSSACGYRERLHAFLD